MTTKQPAPIAKPAQHNLGLRIALTGSTSSVIEWI
jgi:hypothetical protein